MYIKFQKIVSNYDLELLNATGEKLEKHLKSNPNEKHGKIKLQAIKDELKRRIPSTSSSSSNHQEGGYIKYANHKYKIRIGPKGGQYILRYGKKIYI